MTQGDTDAADSLREMASGADAAQAKAARRGLYLLSQRGVRPSERAADAPSSVEPTRSPGAATAAWLSGVSGRGIQVLLFERPDAWGGSPWITSAAVSFPGGLQDVRDRKVPARTRDAWMADLLVELHVKAVPAPLDYALHRLLEAAGERRASGSPLPQGYVEAAAILGSPGREFPRPLAYELPGMDEGTIATRTDFRPEALFEHPEVEAWTLEPSAAAGILSRVAQAGNTRVALEEHQRRQMMDRVLDDATDEHFAGAGLRALQRRLEELALYLHLAGELDAARQALHHAAIASRASVPHLCPFARLMVLRSVILVGMALDGNRAGAGQGGDEPEETDGGIIIAR